MSYRAFKRLLGETSLERKCRFLFGAGVLLLIALSFWLYAYQTEHLAFGQAVTSCRLLVGPVFKEQHLAALRSSSEPRLEGKALAQALNLPEIIPPDGNREYQYQFHFLVESRSDADSYERDLFRE